MAERDYKLTVSVVSENGGKMNQRLTLEEWSDDAKTHVKKNFALTDAIFPNVDKSFKDLASDYLK